MNEHKKILVSKIHPNPHRDFELNPLRDEQVDKIVDSIGRTGFWDNVVVRPHPDRPGEYQLAYGHNRLQAVQRTGIETVTLPVRDLTDWDMYCAMVDENESQLTITPAVAFENVRVGIRLIEKAFREIGEEGTEQEFNEALERRCVENSTHRDSNDHSFERTRKAFFNGEGIGRIFLDHNLPGNRLDVNVVSDVLASIYGTTRAENKARKAEKVEKIAERRREQARKTRDPAKAKQHEQKAEKAEQKASSLRGEATRIGEGSIDEKILLRFENTYQMRMFAAAVKSVGVTKKFHQAAYEHIKETGILAGRQMEEALAKWWYQTSGQADRDASTYQREQAAERFRKKVKDGDYQQFLAQLVSNGKQWVKNVRIAKDAAPYYDNQVHRRSAHETLLAIHGYLGELVEALSGEPQAFQEPLSNGKVASKFLTMQEEDS